MLCHKLTLFCQKCSISSNSIFAALKKAQYLQLYFQDYDPFISINSQLLNIHYATCYNCINCVDLFIHVFVSVLANVSSTCSPYFSQIDLHPQLNSVYSS